MLKNTYPGKFTPHPLRENHWYYSIAGNKLFKSTKGGGFIVIEGLDGSGKSAQVELLVNFLKENGKEVILTKEPTMDSGAGRKIRQVLKKEIIMEPLELQKLYVQDRKEHLDNKIIPALKQGKFVVSSRYAFSTFAYGFSEGLNFNLLIDLNKNFLLPDITFVINVSPESCIKRIEGRGEDKEYFEEKGKLEKVNEIYKKMPVIFENVIMINGEQTIREVFEEVKKIVKNKI
ncbi:MAG: dTMP kinase [Patescibacteria group bacterium]